ncbi:hypothetical protein BKA82DRAFT_1008982, partial [Pisolithus tinctorius]
THKQGKGWRRRVKGRLGDVYNRLIPEKYSAHVSIPPPRIRSQQIFGLRTRRHIRVVGASLDSRYTTAPCPDISSVDILNNWILVGSGVTIGAVREHADFQRPLNIFHAEFPAVPQPGLPRTTISPWCHVDTVARGCGRCLLNWYLTVWYPYSVACAGLASRVASV